MDPKHSSILNIYLQNLLHLLVKYYHITFLPVQICNMNDKKIKCQLYKVFFFIFFLNQWLNPTPTTVFSPPEIFSWHWPILLLGCPPLDPTTERPHTSTRWQCLNHPRRPHPLTVNCDVMWQLSITIKCWQHMVPMSWQHWSIVNTTGYNMAETSG